MTDFYSILFLEVEKQRKESSLPVWRETKDRKLNASIFHL
jgi:hypothetical protein